MKYKIRLFWNNGNIDILELKKDSYTMLKENRNKTFETCILIDNWVIHAFHLCKMEFIEEDDSTAVSESWWRKVFE